MNEFLKDFLSEETFNKVCEELTGKEKEIKLANLASGEYVSKDKYSAVETQLDNTQTLLNSKAAEYDALKEKAGDNEALKTEIENLKTGYATEKDRIEKTYKEQLKKSAVENAIITGYKPKDVKDILPLIELDKITIDDNGITGLKDQLEPIQANKAYLFESKGDDKPNKGGLQHGDAGDIDESALMRAFGIKEK